jgi:hypothetical protein
LPEDPERTIMKKTPEEQAEHLRRCLKKITLKFLKTGWGIGGIKDLKWSKKLALGSDKLLYLSEWKKRGYTEKSHLATLFELHCIWSENHDKTLNKKRKNNLKHIFVSQICDVAVAEYAKVCRMLGIKTIYLISFKDDKKFFKKSKKLLKIPGVEINTIEW